MCAFTSSMTIACCYLSLFHISRMERMIMTMLREVNKTDIYIYGVLSPLLATNVVLDKCYYSEDFV